jgi:hypothetical protein
MNIDKYNISEPDLYPLVISKRLIKIIKKIDNRVSKEIFNLIRKGVKCKETFIDRTDKEDMITFINSDKVNKMIEDKIPNLKDECWKNAQRIELKIGRWIFRLLGDTVQQQDIEEFINEYKSIILAKKSSHNFKLIEGEEIKKWYLQENYSEGGGNLKDSCMRYKFCQIFFDIYTHNPNKIKLLVLLDETQQKVLGRALVWNLDRPEKILMGRVYFSNDYILNMFINYAIKHNWLYKLESMDNYLQVVYNNKIVKQTLVVKIKKEDHDYFPFVDDLGFYDPETSCLTNDPKYLESIGCKEFYDLCDHTGGYEVRKDFKY